MIVFNFPQKSLAYQHYIDKFRILGLQGKGFQILIQTKIQMKILEIEKN